MPLTTVDAIFGGPWGIVEHRRKEIEDGPFGSFEKIYQQEVDRHFIGVEKACEIMDCCDDTARRWLRRIDGRYIAGEFGANLHYLPDVQAARLKRHQAKAETSRKAEEKRLRKQAKKTAA